MEVIRNDKKGIGKKTQFYRIPVDPPLFISEQTSIQSRVKMIIRKMMIPSGAVTRVTAVISRHGRIIEIMTGLY